MSEYQNALANQKQFNCYFTWLHDQTGKSKELHSEYHTVKEVYSIGLILPVWSNDKEDSWSLIGQGTLTAETMTGRKEDDTEIYATRSFAGGGIRADYGIVSVGFICGNYGTYGGSIDSGKDDRFRYTVPISLGLSDQTVFIDKLIANFAFDNFDLTQLLANLVFTTLNIGTMHFGINVYYKDEVYNVAASQRKIGASFTAKYLQFDGGYRFFTMTSLEPYMTVPRFEDGPYGRVFLKIPFAEMGALAFSASIDDLFQEDGLAISYGIGFSLFGSAWQIFGEGHVSDTLRLGTHVNLRANE
jgi:hypothetical protein